MPSKTRICIPVCAKTLTDLGPLIHRAEQLSEFIELRLDCLEIAELVILEKQLPDLLAHLSNPVILTFRSLEQGGYKQTTLEERTQFWRSNSKTVNGLFDIEYDLCVDEQKLAGVDWSRVICSHHDFTGIPPDIEKLYEKMAATKAAVLKIAVQANDAIDCLPIFRLIERAKSEGRQLIALAMGEAGVFSRILGPSRGSFLTYCALEEGGETASGQITAEQMQSVYRIQNITSETTVYGLTGSPVMHSISPQIHNAALDATDIDGVYLPFEVNDLESFIQRLVHPTSRELDWNVQGLSVTAPHKVEVMRYLDWVDPRAIDVGAVNTVVVDENRLLGYNTDVDGFIEPLLNAFELGFETPVALIGAGGAAKAAIWSLMQRGIQPAIFARDQQKGKSLAERFGVSSRSLEGANFEEFEIVINATPLGSSGSRVNETPATAEQLRGVRLVYDLVYNPTETRFIREARSAGCDTLGGLEMLIAQAMLQFKLWTGQEAPSTVMRNAARSSS